MPPVLVLYEDVFPNDATLALPALPRMIFVVHGGITIADRSLSDGESWHGEGAATLAAGTAGATCWRFELASASGRRQRQSRRELACEAFGAARHLAGGRPPAARRQRRLSARRLRLSAPPSGARHPLSARGRHPHRHPWPLDVVRTGRRLVRDRARRGVRAGRRRSSQPLHSRHDPAARARRQKLDPVRQRGRQGQAARAAVQDLRRRADRTT